MTQTREPPEFPGRFNLPKGTDLSGYTQEQLDAIAYELNIRPRKRFGFKCPIEVMTELMAKHHEAPASLQ